MRLSAITPAGRKRTGERPVAGGAGVRAARSGGTRGVGAPAPRPGGTQGTGARATRAAAGSRTARAGARATRAAAGSRTARAGAGGTRAVGGARTGRAGATAARAAATAHPRRLRTRPAPSAPRRVSGPLRRDRAPARSQIAPSPRLRTVSERAGAFLRSLPDRALIDRLVRGQAWIPVLGLMLAGIVAMQVEVLKLGASVGRSIERSSALQTRNQLLRASVASLSDGARIERLAAGMGMIMPPPASPGFVSVAPSNLQKAIANIGAPSPATFLASTSSNGVVASTGIMSGADGSIVANPPVQSGSSTTTTTSSAAATATPTTSPTTTAGPTSATPTTSATSTAATAPQQSAATGG